MTKQQIRDHFLETATLIVATVPGLLLSFYALQEPWALYRMARAVGSLDTGQMPTYSNSASAYHAEHLGSEILFSALHNSTNWDPAWLALLPIGSLLSVLIYYSIAQIITPSKFSPIALALYIGWYYPRLYSQYSVQSYAWTNNLFIGFLILFYFWLKERRLIYSILIFIVFIVNFFFYQTTPVWMIIAMTFAVAVLKIKEGTKPNISWSIPLFMLVFYFTFDTIFYGNYLAHMRSETTNEALYQNFFSKIIIPLLQKTDESPAPYVVLPINPPLATYLTLASLLLMVLPVGYWIITKIIVAIKRHNLSAAIDAENDIFIWAILFVNFAHIFGYLGYGAVSTRVIPLVFPILLLMIFPKERMQNILLGALAIVSMVGFVSFISSYQPDQKVEELGNSFQLLRENSTVLADANVFALLQLRTIQYQKLIDFAWTTPNEYEMLVNGDDVTKYPIDYWALDKSYKPIVTYHWVFMAPWVKHFEQIENNPYLNRIYDSERLTLFQPINLPLPDQIETQQIGQIDQNSFPLNFVLALIGLIVILFLPGSILMLILGPALRINHVLPFCAISSIISLCIVVILGYPLNFVSQLNILGVAVLLISGISMCVPLWHFTRSHSFSLSVQVSGLGLILFFTFLCYWTLAATSIAHARTGITKGFTEFFVTQSDLSNQEEVVQVYAINNTHKKNEYQLIVMGENDERYYPPFSLAPGGTHIYQFYKKYLLSTPVTTLKLVDNNGKSNILTIRWQ